MSGGARDDASTADAAGSVAGVLADGARWIALFGGVLRAHGIGATVRDEIDAAAALALVDRGDRDEVARALRIALKIRREAWDAFDLAFARFWSYGDVELGQPPPPARPPAPREQPPRLLSWDPVQRRLAVPDQDDELPGGTKSGTRPAASPLALLRRKSFDAAAWSAQELAAMERLLTRLARRLATCRSRRLIPAPGMARGRVDPRRSQRRALATGGEMLRFARRVRAVQEPRLVFLCDTSGSMDAHTRFLLMFVLALRRASRRAELFAFNTELVDLGRDVMPGKIRLTLDRLAARVPDWSGGTRIGASLARFADRYLARLGGARTVVVVLSDGLDRGDPQDLAGAVRRIRARVRRLVWLNPLLGDPRYRPAARGMAAALPFIDCFAPAHNLESLEQLLPQLVV
jgi:uncharacterized protein with von Willebrand factor type A (vWA) domain